MSTEEYVKELEQKIARVKAALKSEKFDVRESGMYVDNVIEVAAIQKALDGPTLRERVITEIDKHEDDIGVWDDDLGEMVCHYCKSVLDKEFKCPESEKLRIQHGIEGFW